MIVKMEVFHLLLFNESTEIKIRLFCKKKKSIKIPQNKQSN